MANVLRNEKTNDREWWLEEDGGEILLKCSNRIGGWNVLCVTNEG